MSRRSRSILAAAAFLLVLGPASAAPAEAPVRDGLAPAPQVLFDEGTRLYKAGDPAAARDAFERAHASSGEPRILYNVAVCEKAMGHYARAIALLEKSLAGAEPASDAYRRRASDALTTLRGFVAPVRLEASPADAVFTIDGTPVAENPVLLDTGTHAIVARRNGYDAMTKVVTVRSPEPLQVRFGLEPSTQPGTVRVTCREVPACEVRVGEEALGRAPVTFRREAGTYVVRATAHGRPVAERAIVVANGTTQDLALEGAPPPLARLRVTTDQLDDVVSVDGVRAGRSGVEIELAPGEHRVLVARPGGPGRNLDVLLRENETRDLRFPLEGDERKSSATWWIVGGAGAAVVIGAVVTTIFLATRPTRFEGSAAGTLNPYLIPAARGGDLR